LVLTSNTLGWRRRFSGSWREWWTPAWAALLSAALLVGMAGLNRTVTAWSRWWDAPLPPVALVDADALYIDDRALPVTIRGGIAP
jgi:hypothetical protein